MRVELFGQTTLVASVDVQAVGACMEVVINCSERWPFAQRIGASFMFAEKHASQLPEHDCIVVMAHEEGAAEDLSDNCHIVLIPENEEDRAGLRGICYLNVEKEQVAFIYVPRDLLRYKKKLGGYRTNHERIQNGTSG